MLLKHKENNEERTTNSRTLPKSFTAEQNLKLAKQRGALDRKRPSRYKTHKEPVDSPAGVG